MRKVIDGLWIGNAMDARNIRELHAHEVRAVVDLAMEERPVAETPRELIYCRIPLIDGADNNSSSLKLALGTTRHLILAKTPTLVACSGGMSRAPAITAAALALARGESADESLQLIVAGHPHDVLPQLWRDVLAAIDSLS